MISDFISGTQSRLLGFEATGYTHHLFLPPWYLYVIAPFVTLTGGEPLALVYLTFFTGILTIVLVFLIGKKVFGNRSGLVAALIYTVWDRPNTTEKSIFAISLITFLCSLILYLVIKAEETKKRKWFFFLGCALGFSLSLHYQMLIPIALIVFRVWWKDRKYFLAIVLPLIISWLPIFIFDLRHQFFNTIGLFYVAKTILSGGSPYSSAHYVLFLYIPFVLALGFLASKFKLISFLSIMVIVVWWILIVAKDQPSMSYLVAENVAKKILNNYSPGMKVNFVGPDSYNYRYLITLRAKNLHVDVNSIRTFDPWNLDPTPDIVVQNGIVYIQKK